MNSVNLEPPYFVNVLSYKLLHNLTLFNQLNNPFVGIEI